MVEIILENHYNLYEYAKNPDEYFYPPGPETILSIFTYILANGFSLVNFCSNSVNSTLY